MGSTYNRKYYEEHKSQLLKQCADYKKQNKLKVLAAAKAYREKHRDRILAYKRLHRARLLAETTEWRRQNKDHVRAYVTEYKRRNRHVLTLLEARRRARKFMNGPVTFTLAEWEAVKVAFRQRCAYCRRRKPLTMDHVVPISKGGTHCKENIVPACKSCNSSKNNREAPTFQSKLVFVEKVTLYRDASNYFPCK